MCNSDREVPAFAEGVSISGPLVRLMTSFVVFLFFFSAFFLWVDSVVSLSMVLSVKVGVGGGSDSGVCRLYGVVVYWKIASALLLKKNMVCVCLERKEKISRRSC
jgi:hypothetical protein